MQPPGRLPLSPPLVRIRGRVSANPNPNPKANPNPNPNPNPNQVRSLASELPGRRLIVFVCGGLSYSELRAMHEVAAETGRDIIIGTTAMLTPKRFLLGLKNLKQLDLDGSSQRL